MRTALIPFDPLEDAFEVEHMVLVAIHSVDMVSLFEFTQTDTAVLCARFQRPERRQVIVGDLGYLPIEDRY